MPHVDLVVLVLLVVGLIAGTVLHVRRGARGRRLLAAAFATFYGHTLVTMLTFHCVDVLYVLVHRLPSPMTGATVAYDWRTYSLLLFGALLVRLGARSVGAALRLGRGDPAARGDLLRLTALVLAVVLPVVPIHAFFGYLISGASALTMLVVGVAGRAPAPTPTAADAAASAVPA